MTLGFDAPPIPGLPSGTPMSRSMPKRLAAILVVLLPVPMLAAPMQLAHSGQLRMPHEHKHLEREQIVALENQWRQAQLSNDVPAMDKLLSDDYLGINANGDVVTKNQQLDHMRNRQLVIEKLDISDLKIKLIGPIAIVTSLAEVEGTLDATPLSGSFRYTRVYQRLAGGGWKITNFEVTHIPHSRHKIPQATGQSSRPTVPLVDGQIRSPADVKPAFRVLADTKSGPFGPLNPWREVITS
jgi:ketosteroid isomerase-like protein